MGYSGTYSVWVYLERAEIASAALSGLGGVVGGVKLFKRHCGPLCSSCGVPLSVWLAYTVTVCGYAPPPMSHLRIAAVFQKGLACWSKRFQRGASGRCLPRDKPINHYPFQSLPLLTLALLYYYPCFEFYYYDGFIIIVCKICITSHPVGCAKFA